MLLPLQLLLAASGAAAASCPNNLKTKYPAPEPRDGWTARVVANEGLSKPRSLLFDGAGALLVLDQDVGVLRLQLEDHGGSCVTVANTTTVVDDSNVSLGPVPLASGVFQARVRR